jgi:hypothetical protein
VSLFIVNCEHVKKPSDIPSLAINIVSKEKYFFLTAKNIYYFYSMLV